MLNALTELMNPCSFALILYSESIKSAKSPMIFMIAWLSQEHVKGVSHAGGNASRHPTWAFIIIT